MRLKEKEKEKKKNSCQYKINYSLLVILNNFHNFSKIFLVKTHKQYIKSKFLIIKRKKY